MELQSNGTIRRRVAQQQRRMRHRILSIAVDHQWIRHAVSHLNLPCYANLRCGLWYAQNVCTGTAYFKSTDGHANTWNFSLRRLNLNIVEAAANSKGIILVDATKRGRRLPDAFSRTIPIWCAVINRAINTYRSNNNIANDNWDIALHVPPRIVSPEEKTIVTQKLNSLVDSFLTSDAVDIEWLSKTVGQRPLRTFWMTTESHLIDDFIPDYTCDGQYSPIICLSASEPIEDTVFRLFRRVNEKKEEKENTEADVGFFYIPGAGDDHEKWSCGLTPQLLYQNFDLLLNACKTSNDDDVDSIVATIVEEWCAPSMNVTNTNNTNQSGSCSSLENYHRLGNTHLYVGTRRAGRPPECWNTFDAILCVTELQYEDMKMKINMNMNMNNNDKKNIEMMDTAKNIGDSKRNEDMNTFGRYLHLSIPEGKKDSKDMLLKYLPQGLSFVLLHLAQGHRVLIHCNQGVDRSVGIAAAIVALCVERKGHVLLNMHPWCQKATLKSLTMKRRCILFEEKDGDGGGCVCSRTSRDGFFEWLNEISGGCVLNVDKGVLRATLVGIIQYRHVASPSRYTMRKLSRFFTERKV